MINPRVKTVSSTSTVEFRNTSGAYYDMIISIQNQTIDQSITITDTEGNSITENPIVLSVPAKIIVKDTKVGTITFSDTNSYNVIISYVVKENATGIPYVDIDYQNGYTYSQETGTPVVKSVSFKGDDGTSLTPPTGKKWILRSITLSWEAAATQSDYPRINIEPTTFTGNLLFSLNLYYSSLSVTSGDDYIIDLAKYVQSRSSSLISVPYVSEETVTGGFELYDTETLNLIIGSETATVSGYISYIEVNLG